MNILHLDSSITGDNSASRALSAAIVRELTDADPSASVTYRDLVAQPLDHLTLPGFATPQSAQALSEFKAADVVVIGAPMYNFTIPSQLKAWIDRVLVAGETFRYTESGPEGLAGDKTVIVALARGGLYGEGTAQRSIEHAERYLADALAFIGITEPRFVIAEGLALGDEARDAALASAHEAVRRIGAACPVA
ncbi:FMN-dependent NADH-azoreductase 1 [Tsuneonella dongtanensis]|uniref:FMN dependent NADH:quinone oxidoreductase n=1 Tax=Tsuneonella dongtanensis TaxID=692370 RepID=A0A1B2AGF6_9SPHN|nr:NAD(P)H-dependent oxidoreductase [Tsuneonella dongtanensis]ANY21220.1 FMN-dependent NADH-azoreductase 1 [Tsuneonella dongtanensis]